MSEFSTDSPPLLFRTYIHGKTGYATVPMDRFATVHEFKKSALLSFHTKRKSSTTTKAPSLDIHTPAPTDIILALPTAASTIDTSSSGASEMKGTSSAAKVSAALTLSESPFSLQTSDDGSKERSDQAAETTTREVVVAAEEEEKEKEKEKENEEENEEEEEKREEEKDAETNPDRYFIRTLLNPITCLFKDIIIVSKYLDL